MLFGRKSSASGSPKRAGADHAAPDQPEGAAAEAPLSHAAGRFAAPPGYAPPATTTPTPATTPSQRSPYADKGSEMTTSTPKPPNAPSLSGSGLRNDTPRRVVDIPGGPTRRSDAPAAPVAAAAPGDQQRRLTVGRDISLSGEITSCDVLVVEGTVEAKLRDGRSIEIAESGLFKGSVEIDQADIAGRFEGDITVRGRLRLRASGRINGSIRYGELEVEAGGRLVGDIQVVEAGAPSVARPAPAAPMTFAPAEPVPGHSAD